MKNYFDEAIKKVNNNSYEDLSEEKPPALVVRNDKVLEILSILQAQIGSFIEQEVDRKVAAKLGDNY